MNLWKLPETARFGDTTLELNTDFRVVLKIFSILAEASIPEPVRWHMALRSFYRQEVPIRWERQAMDYLCRFIAGGQDLPSAGEKLFDWTLDADAIIADINAVAGKEIRREQLHWWTFLSYFHSIGAGQLGFLVQLRRKLRRGQKLEGWEQEFYRENKARVDLRRPLNPEELEEKQRLSALLGR